MNGRITVNPDMLNGKPALRNKRISVETILGHLRAGDSREEILENYPSLEPEDIDACYEFAMKISAGNFEVMSLINA